MAARTTLVSRLATGVLLLSATSALAAPAGAKKPESINHWAESADTWFSTDEGKLVLANVIGRQLPCGGWPKNYDALTPPGTEDAEKDNPLIPAGDRHKDWLGVGTIDNDATYSELRLLARAIRLTPSDAARAAFDRGVEFILKMQYPNGGFPQRFPLQNNYGRHITFNDDAMLGVMEFCRDAGAGQVDFAFVPPATRERLLAADAKALDCILACQVRQGGVPTIWGQQHDEVTLAPAKARAYELPSLCSNESASITLYLMKIRNPDARIREAVEGAVAYFEKTAIFGQEYSRLTGPQYEKGSDRLLHPKPDAPAIWARFYDLDTNTPLFSDRDSSRHSRLEEISYERRNGYSWYSEKPGKVLERYAKWKEKRGGN